MGVKQVATTADLVAACQDRSVTQIEVMASLEDVPCISLSPGQTLFGSSGIRRTLTFLPDTEGLGLTTNNTVHDLSLQAASEQRAIWNDITVSTLGTLTLQRVSTVGQVRIIARDGVRAGHVDVSDLNIIAADTRSATDRPREYGVSVLQGAFTLWNMQPDPQCVITANLARIAAGRAGSPVVGGGVFVSGAGDQGGRLRIQTLETSAIFSHGMIQEGTPDVISGGVFTVYGCEANLVRISGPVTTYGPNDMALDNWGSVDRWISSEIVTTHGPSGIGL